MHLSGTNFNGHVLLPVTQKDRRQLLTYERTLGIFTVRSAQRPRKFADSRGDVGKRCVIGKMVCIKFTKAL